MPHNFAALALAAIAAATLWLVRATPADFLQQLTTALAAAGVTS